MRHARPAAGLILATFLALVWSAAAEKCETIDEGLFIGGGIAQVRFADVNFDLSHPPLLRWLAGVPAVLAGAKAPPGEPSVLRGPVELYTDKLQTTYDWSQRAFYQNDHDRVLFAGRLLFALLGALAGWLLFLEAQRRFGDVPALGALAM